jgi:hypothetical protein
MKTTRVVRRSAVHRSATLLAVGLLMAAGAQHAAAASAGSGATGTATMSASASSSGSASATSTSSSSSAGSGSSAPGCPTRVRLTLGPMTADNGVVTIVFTHTGHGCSSAQPALLHVHQNLLTAPRAGSDPVHQRNDDFTIGPDHADQVTVPLLQAVPGKCFVQVDAHAGGAARGQFFPTTTCPSPSQSSPAPSSSASSSSPTQSSSPPSSTASTSTPPSSTAQTSTAPASTSMAPSTSQSFLSASETRSAGTITFVPVAQQSQPPPSGSLASTGASPAVPLGLAAVLLIAGSWLMYWARRPRRH